MSDNPDIFRFLIGAPSNKTTTESAKEAGSGVASTITGGAKVAYGTIVGDETAREQGRQEYYGEKH
jgi:hypothetical protein